mgnify:FL=1
MTGMTEKRIKAGKWFSRMLIGVAALFLFRYFKRAREREEEDEESD